MVTYSLNHPPFAADLKTFLPLIYLATVVIAGLVALVLVSRWWRAAAPPRLSASDELAQYRALYEKGAISEEEFRKLRALLGGEIRKNLALPAPEDRGQPPGEQPPSTPGIRPA